MRFEDRVSRQQFVGRFADVEHEKDVLAVQVTNAGMRAPDAAASEAGVL